MTERIGYPEYITNDTRLEGEYTNVSPNGMCIPLFSVLGSVMGQLLYCYGPHYEMGVAHTIGLSQRMSRSKMVPTAHSIVHSGTAVPTRPSPNPFCTTTTGCLHYFDMTLVNKNLLWLMKVKW